MNLQYLLVRSALTWLISLLTLTGNVAITDSIPLYILEDGPEGRVIISEHVEIALSHRKYTSQEIIGPEAPPFGILPDSVHTNFPLTLWARIRLRNQSPDVQNLYLGFCNLVDSVSFYTLKDGRLQDLKVSGAAIDPFQKKLITSTNHIPLELGEGEEITAYFKLQFSQPVSPEHLGELFIQSDGYVLGALLEKFAVQFFYAGLMLLFSLLSLFTYLLFRDRTFIYFAGVQLSFTFYFLSVSGIIDTLLLRGHSFPVPPIFLSLSVLVLSVGLFVNAYIRIRQHYPRYYHWYMALTVFTALSNHLGLWILQEYYQVAFYYNVVLIVWIIFTFIPILLLARGNSRQARNLLVALSVLFLTSLLYVIYLLGYFPQGFPAGYSVQAGTLLFALLVFYGLFDQVNAIKLDRQKMENLEQLKSRFFANISHEFRTPLTLLLGPIEQLREKAHEASDKKLLDTAHTNAQRLLDLINQLLDLARLESGKMQLQLSELNFPQFLKGIVMSFESLALRKNIRLHFMSRNTSIPLWIDREKTEVIFYNLLSNAFKFTDSGGEVAVGVSEDDEQVEIVVRDNGIGIPEDQLAHIFDRFYQVQEASLRQVNGSGIGLALVQELVQLQQGSIRVESTEDEGTTFILSFRKCSSHLSNEGLPDSGTKLQYKASVIDTETSVTEEEAWERPLSSTPLLLLIEDNADIRDYIRQQLQGHFRLEEAVNGREGIEKALELHPDLVISDVMMPEKDGYEVCHFLKQDERTSHIPVILLTARASQEEKLKGLEYGADDYLLKPFHSRELEVRVRKLIELRVQLRRKIQENPTLNFSDLGGNPADLAFMEKINGCIEKYMDDNQFGVGTLAENMGMSSVHLNRKLNALTGYSSGKYIQQTRLRRALNLLENTRMNVSEVALETGFSSTAYFVKCFREHYGKTPGSIQQKTS
ncbi:MAG TPA: hypothetical protein DDW81_18750 [Cryomorphaceae bacterium]|nr:hypothetical protein [Cryomorphaceae bacterium]